MTASPRYTRAAHRYLATAGDVNPAEYGGGYVIRVSPRGQPSYVSLFVVEWDSDADDAVGSLYEADLRDRDVAAAHNWIDVDKMAASMDFYPDAWRAAARGNYRQRAGCLMDIAGYYGWANLDSYPRRVTRGEVRRMWARVGVGSCRSLPGV